MRPALGVPLADDLVHQLARRLLGHPEVRGQVGGGGPVGGEPREGEAVGGPEVREAAGDHPVMDALSEVARHGEQGGGQGQGVGVLHGGIETPLTEWSS